jgi:replication factor A1|tara:strand:+ start:899 stop:1198 length:300 start_codon:yes stop_codon:yes gene_type:complete
MTQVTIETAKNMRSGIDVNGQITKLGQGRNVNLKAGGTVMVTDATLTDDSGDIQLALWGEDVNGIKVGSKVSIINGYTNTFKDQVSLTKGKFGQLVVVE